MTTRRIVRPGENVQLSQVYSYGAWAMWMLSGVATAFALFPLMFKLAVLAGAVGESGEITGAVLALLSGFGLQWFVTVAERPVLRFHLSPLVLLALAADLAINWFGLAAILPLVVETLSISSGLIQMFATIALTLGPEIFWALGRRSAEKGF